MIASTSAPRELKHQVSRGGLVLLLGLLSLTSAAVCAALVLLFRAKGGAAPEALVASVASAPAEPSVEDHGDRQEETEVAVVQPDPGAVMGEPPPPPAVIPTPGASGPKGGRGGVKVAPPKATELERVLVHLTGDPIEVRLVRDDGNDAYEISQEMLVPSGTYDAFARGASDQPWTELNTVTLPEGAKQVTLKCALNFKMCREAP